ncbi:MAG: NAD(P)-dependent oxidoreductase [Candidatus Micrarchaeota archaeon]|nr:NAD(P)-dependent oxidoreductase [Candidatus Micrarchaeota archaeon]MDE1847626.1 NAD(P)-dependent oxidoreductase [Candidatus Micrarchaeota archaeon]MDE1863829.1 NAD(P)-dependent oxidoreductase [Candidatus Micrarchaeota archaeon]
MAKKDVKSPDSANTGGSGPRSSGKVSVVTGASGKMGRQLIKQLLWRGDTVRALVKRKEMILELPAGAIPFLGDINDQKVLETMCSGADYVFHLAAIVSAFKAATQEIMRVNVEGTRNLLDACEAGKVRHVVFLSTVDVYGHVRHDVLREDSKLDPRDRYGLSKVLAEEEILKYVDKVPFTIFRCAQIYGEGFEYYFFRVFRAIKEQKAYLIGDGQNKLNLIHVNDAINAMLLATTKRESIHQIYNLSDGKTYTQEQLFNLAADLLGVPRPSRHISRLIIKFVAKQRNIDVDELRFLTSNRNMDTGKIKGQLGFFAKVEIKDGAKEFVGEFVRTEGHRKALDLKNAHA